MKKALAAVAGLAALIGTVFVAAPAQAGGPWVCSDWSTGRVCIQQYDSNSMRGRFTNTTNATVPVKTLEIVRDGNVAIYQNRGPVAPGDTVFIQTPYVAGSLYRTLWGVGSNFIYSPLWEESNAKTSATPLSPSVKPKATDLHVVPIPVA